jgi:glutamate formiminotransferase/formiminotetrahydrofolate cyclodeaminase
MMPNQLVECVPNFSEGRDEAKIAQIVGAVKSVSGVRLLHVDPGWDMNRTVVTFVGTPQAVAEAAFRSIAKAAQLIDMSMQQGSHPRIGATDVFPFVPIEGVTLADCVEIARQVAARVGGELHIPVYLYEAAATTIERANLANIRKGEYEGLAEKLRDLQWKPDFGPAVFNPRTGATVIGAREFLIAYNITLNTRDKHAAADIAFELRQRGRVARSKTKSPYYHHGEVLCYRENHYPCGNCDFLGETFAETQSHCRSAHGYDPRDFFTENLGDAGEVVGRKVPRAGKYKFCKAIGWYADAFKRAQISINLTNFHITPPHLVLEEARKLAAERGLVVTGSEIVGMIPYAALLEAGKYYLQKQRSSAHVPFIDILETAVFSMGLNDVQPFEVEKKVLGLPRQKEHSLVEMKVGDFVDEVSRDTPTPGGGSVAALAGSLGTALASMVANIEHHKIDDGEMEKIISCLAEKAQAAKEKLLQAVDDDAEAYNAYLEALRLPSDTTQEKAFRAKKIQDSLKQAVEVPYQTSLASFEAMQVAYDIAQQGHATLSTDAAVGCEIAFIGVRGSIWNVAANLKEIEDPQYVMTMRDRCAMLLEKAKQLRQKNESMIDEKLTEVAKIRL